MLQYFLKRVLLMIPTIMIAGFLAGGLMMVIPAMLKQRFGADEVVIAGVFRSTLPEAERPAPFRDGPVTLPDRPISLGS